VGSVYLQSRLDFLRAVQNSDGGWGYFPAKQSWMEPTVYAVLALLGQPDTGVAVDSAWRFIKSLQEPDGRWHPSAQVKDVTWVTALGVLVSACLERIDSKDRGAVDWLLGTKGAEASWKFRLSARLHLLKTEANIMHLGWPWLPGAASWIEPTALTVLALQKVTTWMGTRAIQDRISEGQKLIMSRRNRDGGWNYGNPNTLSVDAPSYPETTAVGLMGLQGSARDELAIPLAAARTWYTNAWSPLGRAWLTVALRLFGDTLPDHAADLPKDIMLCALQALGATAGNYRLLQVQGVSA
jgi:hypothetical protein